MTGSGHKLTNLAPRIARGNLMRVGLIGTDQARVKNNSAAHRMIKAAVRKRSRGLCECTACRRSGTPLPAQQFDHVIPLWEGGTNDLGNWQHLNVECHKAKTAAETRRRLGIDP